MILDRYQMITFDIKSIFELLRAQNNKITNFLPALNIHYYISFVKQD